MGVNQINFWVWKGCSFLLRSIWKQFMIFSIVIPFDTYITHKHTQHHKHTHIFIEIYSH